MKFHSTIAAKKEPWTGALARALALVLACLLGALAGCGGNGSTGTPPANLVYPQSAITVIAGQAMSATTPTVTGSVTSYSVSPALPAGLSLNASTGAISGTATAVTAQATYTITATNSSGSTSTTVQITVNPVAPTNLVYPQVAITAIAGQAISTDTPTVTSTVSSYAVSPALPAGLSLSSSTGAISGTPTAVSSQASYVITATNASGSTTATVQITVNPVAPANLVYPQAMVTAIVGQAITVDLPTVAGTVSSYAVSPALPAGLSFNASTGAISGTPAAVSAKASYVVTATNASGSTTATVQITVNPVAPTNLVYPQVAITAIAGQAISADAPTVTGTVSSYGVSPALPAGLSLNASTGAISGTPTTVSAAASYTVTATNASGSTTATVQIAVNPVAPTSLVYPQGTITAIAGQAIGADTPTVTGTVSSYAVSPALPVGLSFNTSTGAIAGTPTAVSAQASYTVTATNASGSTTATVQITVNPVAPTSLVYPQGTITAVAGQAISADTPTVTGTVSSYAVSPALPAGLSLNASTGAIAGTPTAVSAQASYTVTATNVSGSTTAVVQITVNPVAPSNLVYALPAITATAGQAISADTPTVTGTVTSFAVSPSLPAGLSLNASTGVISGTSTGVSAQTVYTVTAANITGSTTTTLQITVNPAAPTNLVYPQSTITAAAGTAITTDAPTVTGTVTSYSVSPGLPAGLNLNASTGAISGTPSAVSVQTSYTVTATNVTGSTTATVQITVGPPAPTNLVYSQTSITVLVGTAIATDVPSVTGTVSSYAVSPALPAGLTFDTSSGAISGTPTVASAQASYTVTASNVSGSTTAVVQISVNPTAPTNLVYPASIVAIVGGAIGTDTPTVTGTVTSYSVTPALPAGLNLNPYTGEISGTPTAASPQMTYTVTASNVSGSTMGTVGIVVNAAAPQNLVYPQTSISAVIGQVIPTDIPSVVGAVTGYSISPALPPGLSFNTANGAISGTPTGASGQATYTIAASNSVGSTTATLQIAANSFSAAELLDLGHVAQISVLRLQSTRMFSQDVGGHWVLWDYSTAQEVASGDPIAWAPESYQSKAFPSDMAGSVLAIGIANGVEIRSSADGSLITTIGAPSLDPSYEGNAWWKLATDGSYLASGNSSGLFVFSTTDGHLLFSLSGDYTQAIAYLAPAQIQIAQGPNGAAVIETDAVPAGTSSLGAAFSGSFNAWFSDGSHYITNSADINPPSQPVQFNYFIYSAGGTQQGTITADNVSTLGGYANWFWINDPLIGGAFNVYAVGSTTPTTTVAGLNTVDATIAPFGSTVGLMPYGTPAAYILDLSGPTPNVTQTNLPVAYDGAFAATSPTRWVVGNSHGVLLDGASVAITPRFFGYGAAFSMAGAPGAVAIATASGKILDYNPNSQVLTDTINFTSSQLAMSADGAILAARASDLDYQYETDRTLNVYSLPSGTVTYTFPYTFNQSAGSTDLLAFTMSSSGNALGQVLETFVSASGGLYPNYTREETSLSGSPVLWSDTPPSTFADAGSSLFLSPDGTLVATSTATSGISYSSSSTTSIYKNGSLVATVNGFVVGWIDNNRLLVDTFSAANGPYNPSVYVASVIYDATGAKIATLPNLPMLVPTSTQTSGFITVDSSSIYSPVNEAIYSLTSGGVLWTESYPYPTTGYHYAGVSTLSGNYVVFTSGNRVMLDLP